MKPWHPYLILCILCDIHARQYIDTQPATLNTTLLGIAFGVLSMVFGIFVAIALLKDWRKKS